MLANALEPLQTSLVEEFQRAKILVVDDEPMLADILSRWLGQEGYHCETCGDVGSALQHLAAKHYSLVITDIRMPGTSGLDLAKRIKSNYPDVAVMLTTGFNDRSSALQSAESGACGYIIKPFDRNVVLAHVLNALESQRLAMLAKQYQTRLETEVRRQTQAVHHREEEIAWRLVTASEFRDNETGAHIRRIGSYAALIADATGWRHSQVDEIRVAAMMHDVGKIGVPDQILLKPGRLTIEEFSVMQTHTLIGAEILGGSKIPLLESAREIALSHHERWDGSGYPHGLARKSIPESARIVALADVYDALVHERVYKPAYSNEQAVEIMAAERGRHFDPAIFDIFLQVHPEIRKVCEAACDDDAVRSISDVSCISTPRRPESE